MSIRKEHEKVNLFLENKKINKSDILTNELFSHLMSVNRFTIKRFAFENEIYVSEMKASDVLFFLRKTKNPLYLKFKQKINF